MEPHARAGILVAALFDAYLAIYKTRVETLILIATAHGSRAAGPLPTAADSWPGGRGGANRPARPQDLSSGHRLLSGPVM